MKLEQLEEEFADGWNLTYNDVQKLLELARAVMDASREEELPRRILGALDELR